MNRFDQQGIVFIEDMLNNVGDLSEENKKKWEHITEPYENNFNDANVIKGFPSSAEFNTDVGIDKIVIHEERSVIIEHTFIRRKNED